MKIYTILKSVQVVNKKVFNSVPELCELQSIATGSGEQYHRRVNMYFNWLEAFRLFLESGNDIFVGMDSDVILRPDSIDLLIGSIYSGSDYSTIITNNPTPRNPRYPHSLFAVKKDVLLTIPLELIMYPRLVAPKCPMCNWVREIIKSDFKTEILHNYILQEI